MKTKRRMRAIAFSALMLIQVLAPITYAASPSGPEVIVETDIDLELLSAVGLNPSRDMANGWFNPDEGVGEINLLFRDMGVVGVNDWTDWTGQGSTLNGWYILTHEFPVPTEWFYELEDKGIECFSYLPPNGFQCELNGHTTRDLSALNVEGIVQLDPVDKIREDLVRSLTGVQPYFPNPHAEEGQALVSMILSGETLPENIDQRTDISLKSVSGRYVKAVVETSGFVWLAEQGEIEWIETMDWFLPINVEGGKILHADDLGNATAMAHVNNSWIGLNGSGIIVTVGDTGIDSGVNNSTMHPDIADHIKGIQSWPAKGCAYTSPSDPGPCDDGAEDDDGHGTHVSGSVLGDGTLDPSVFGTAPEAQLLFHAWQQNGCFGCGIPYDLVEIFDLAVENGSQIHTNSWGAPYYGAYTTNSAAVDSGAYKHQDLVIMFAAGNSGSDSNGDGEIDDDSLGSPATAKSAITIGASENNRPTWGSLSDNSSGMAYFSSRGPTDDGRVKPDFVSPGTNIWSTKSRYSGGTGNYTSMSGTSMATPLAAGSTALLLQHLIENRNHTPSSALVKAIYAATAHDMMGQYSSSTNGAGEAIPNSHEGYGRLDMWSALNASFVDNESLSTNEERGWSFVVPASAPKLQLGLSYTEDASAVGAATNLINDLDFAVKRPDGTWSNLSDNLNNLRVLNFDSPAQGTWEVHVLGTSVPSGPQFFSLALNAEYLLVNLTEDADFDGTEDSSDDCAFTFGISINDRAGCPDTDGDGYSDPSSNWTIANGADVFINEATQWRDSDTDGYGDNIAGVTPDSCLSIDGTSTADRYGCLDPDNDTYSSPDGNWTSFQGADSCDTVTGTSNQDRNGCPDEDGDGYSDPDPSGANGSVWLTSNGADAFLGDSTQWNDTDGDGFGDNPPPALVSDACPTIAGTSSQDRTGCIDTDGDGYSDADVHWLAHPTGTADAFPSDSTQWLDSDGDGYGDNPNGTNPDSCVNDLAIGNRSSIDRFGCPDSDGDGYSDADANWPAHPIGSADAFPITVSQWNDTDADGFGDEALGVNPDACLTAVGTSSHDRFGCPDADGDGYSDPDPLGNNGSVWIAHPLGLADAWLNEPTQWADTDADGYGDNPNGVFPDNCITVSGNSTSDRYGCPDSDGDTYSNPDLIFTIANGADVAPNDPLRWSDSDGDGISDQIDDDCPNYNAVGEFAWRGSSTIDRMGCPDIDGDGYSDPEPNWTPADNGSDAFKTDPTQWNDTDGDGYGDNASGNLADDCPLISGESWQNNTLGCIDTDLDGWADQEDAQANDSTQWSDIDGDGFGDNIGGTTPDKCPNLAGNSTLGNRLGCPDTDGDGWDDVIDKLPNLANQWLDQDNDGYGDNATGPQPDACPGTPGNSTIDRYGCVDDDGDGMSNESDAFPNDPNRTQDTDGDGFDDLEDDCIALAGNSTLDRNACPDTDGDGYSDPSFPIGNGTGWNSSDGADALPLNPTQWNDIDGDGYGDNASGIQPDSCPSEEGYSNLDIFGCPDEDNDGSSQNGDAFPDDPTQWSDIDGDGYGDNPNGTQPDNCTTVVGTSLRDVFGCPDSDGDGASDINDLWANDSSQWFDTDGDGFGDNPQGTDGDVCPSVYGIATLGNAPGCIDNDRDGYADSDDTFPNEPTQWVDEDGDGFGDNQSSGASRPDHWINDPTRNVAEAELICTPADIQLDLAGEDYFSFSCTVTSELNDITVRVEWQPITSIIASEQIQTLSFTETTGLTQTIFFSGEARNLGNYELYVTIKEPGVEGAMDSDTVNLGVSDSRIIDEDEGVVDESNALSAVLEMPIVQALFGGIILFFLMGMLVIRGNASKARLAEERVEHAREVLAARMRRINDPPTDNLRQAFGVNGRVPPPPPPRPPMP